MAEQPPTRDERITAATLNLLRAKGPAAVTIEAVAAQSGLAKTTIYRRHRDRDAMLTAALASIAQPPAPQNAADTISIVAWVVEQSYRAVHEGIGVGGIAALLTEADHEHIALLRSIVGQHRTALEQVIRTGIDDRTLRAGIDVDTVMDCIVGAYFSEYGRNGAVAPDWCDRVLRTMLPAIAP